MNGNSVASSASAVTMSSREIAELTGSRHDAVRKSAERLAADQILPSPLAACDYEHRGNIYREYRFNKRDSLVLVARLSPAHIGGVVDAWGRTQASLQELIDALEAFDVPEDLSDLFLYAIREQESGRIKLGISRNPGERLSQLQTGNSQRLELVAVSNAGRGFTDEQSLHQAASRYRIRGEWFQPEALEFMK